MKIYRKVPHISTLHIMAVIMTASSMAWYIVPHVLDTCLVTPLAHEFPGVGIKPDSSLYFHIIKGSILYVLRF